MSKEPKKSTIEVQGTPIAILTKGQEDYISLTDMVRHFEGQGALIEQWLKNKDTVLFLGVWERLNNPAFNSPEFEGIKNEAGRNSFFLAAKKWIERTGTKGLAAQAGAFLSLLTYPTPNTNLTSTPAGIAQFSRFLAKTTGFIEKV